MSTRQLLRAAYRLDQVNRARKNPARFARNRVKVQGLKSVGFYRLMNKFWRA